MQLAEELEWEVWNARRRLEQGGQLGWPGAAFNGGGGREMSREEERSGRPLRGSGLQDQWPAWEAEKDAQSRRL